MALKALYQDPFSPVLLSSPPLTLTEEQRMYIREVLDISCSDSRFAEKAYRAIQFILSGGSVTVPVIASLNPGSATVGDPDFTLHVMGSGFSVLSKIYFNGGEEVTTYVSDHELTTGVSMATVSGANTVPVVVVSGDGVASNAMSFVFQDVGGALLGAKKSTVTVAPQVKPTEVKK